LGSGWHRRLRAARWIVLLAQGDPPHSTGDTTTKDPADNALHRQADRQPSLQVRTRDLGKPTVTTTNNQLVDAPISHTYILPAESGAPIPHHGSLGHN
jgi:hypothetical protein